MLTMRVVYVDDCGPGNTWNVLQNLARQDTRVTAIQLMRNSGQSSATLCGMAHAQGEIVITIDDDLQNPPEEIPKLLDALAPEIDLVMGVPLMKQHNWFRRLGSQAIHTVNAYMLNRDKDLRFTSFRAIRRPVVNAVLNMRTLNPALGMLFSSVTSRIVNTTVLHSPRHGGRSGYTLTKLLSMTMSNLLGYSMLPLRILRDDRRYRRAEQYRPGSSLAGALSHR
ncbi:MAG: glycosyltransferase family 2 protein [Nitrosomonas sp.]|nr:glycosyltransferase family 2 protein [Nitrosomonas sp.]